MSIPPQEICRRASQRIQKLGWWDGTSEDADFVSDAPNRRCCIFTAITRESPWSEDEQRAVELVYRVAGWTVDSLAYPERMIAWNDEPGRKQKDVIRLLEKAAQSE